MRKEYYKTRGIRISEKVWKELKGNKKRGQTWNLFFKKLIEKYGK